jgi:intein/homing endonuclease
MNKYCKILCFDEKVSVKTQKGNIQIKDIVPGMEVVSYDLYNNVLCADKVIATAKSLHEVCAILLFENGISIKCTIDHPLFVEGKGWCAVNDNGIDEMYGVKVTQLKEGANCYLLNGNKISLTKLISIKIIKCSESFYCISTEKNHNFFASNILAHDVRIDIYTSEILSEEGVIVTRM